MTFEREWARCAPWLAAALAHAGNTHALTDVERMVADREAQFWPGRASAAVTTIQDDPLETRVLIWLAGGALGELAGPQIARIERWARARGCRRMLIVGRAGWERALKPQGFAPLARLICKELP